MGQIKTTGRQMRPNCIPFYSRNTVTIDQKKGLWCFVMVFDLMHP